MSKPKTDIVKRIFDELGEQPARRRTKDNTMNELTTTGDAESHSGKFGLVQGSSSSNIVTIEPWRRNLILTEKKNPKALLANAAMALRHAPARQGVLAYDLFSLKTKVVSHPPWDMERGIPWTDRDWIEHDDLLTAEWLQHASIAVNPATASFAVELVARGNSFHPVEDYLLSLEHDGTARVETWLSTYMGAEDTPYNREIGRAILVGAVARIFQPGCKLDTIPIFEGVQGAQKSTAIRALFDPWFTDDLAEMGSKDSAMQTMGVWCIEVGELDAMSRADVSKVKAFIARQTERFRPPYGRRLTEVKRSCVFWGSTNKDDYLKDETGARRFWPIKVSKIDIAALRTNRDQLWAETVALYKAGAKWWLTDKLLIAAAEREQRDRYVSDPWDELISAFVKNKEEVSVFEILREALYIDASKMSQNDQTRVARTLTTLEFQKVRLRVGDKRPWVYRRRLDGENMTLD